MSSIQTLTVNGSLNLASGSTLTLDASPFNSTTPLVVENGGTVRVAAATVTRNGSYFAPVTVKAGGHLIAADSTLGGYSLTLSPGAVFNAGDLSNNRFDLPVYLPTTFVPLLSASGGGADNRRFQDVILADGSLASGTLSLGLIGTETAANLRYVFSVSYTVASGATVSVGAAPVRRRG